jgi:CheY-like chemotaxis protein
MAASFPQLASLVPPTWSHDDRDASSEQPRLQGPGRVLIIDDEPDVRQLFQDILQDAGFAAVAAESGAEGLTRLRQDPQIRVILLDLLMPEMDGWRFRHHQLSHEKFALIPTVIVTGAPLGAAAHEQLKAADYLSKPVSRDRLIAVVARYCDRVIGGDAPVR